MNLYNTAHFILLRLWRCLYRLRIEGAHRVPDRGPVVLAPTHPTYLDPITLGVSLPRPITFMAWDQAFGWPVVGPFVRAVGAIPLPLGSASKSRTSVRRALEVLHEGRAFGIFPEGMRSAGGRLMPFHPGAAQLAVRTGALLVPVSIRGALRLWPRACAVPRPTGRLSVLFHEPIRPPPAGCNRKEAAAELTRLLRAAVASGLDYPALEDDYPTRPALREELRLEGHVRESPG